MPKVPFPPFVSRSADEASLPGTVDARRVDCYADMVGGQVVFRKKPGTELFCDLGVTTPVDALYWWDSKDVVLAVSGGNVYRVTSQDGNFSDVTGDALSPVGHTSITDDGTYAFFASGGRMVHYNNSGTTVQLADSDAPTVVTHLDYLDQYILALVGNSSQFHHSDVGASLNWTATVFANAESNPDDLLAMHVAHREITLFGTKGIEIFYNDGTTPFSRLEGSYQEIGCIAANSIVNANGVWIFLNNDRQVTMLEGRTPRLKSGPYDDVIRNISAVADAYAVFISLGQHAFYLLSFPSENLTVAYDLVTDSWAEWGYWNSASGEHDMWPGKSYCYAKRWQLHLVGDRSTGKIYKLNPAVYQDAGNTIRSLLRSGHHDHGTLRRKTVAELIIRAKRGLGGVSGDEPVFTIRWRDDNGPWGNEVQVSLGKIGENEFIARLAPMGQYRTRQYEIAHTDNTDFVLVEMEEPQVELSD